MTEQNVDVVVEESVKSTHKLPVTKPIWRLPSLLETSDPELLMWLEKLRTNREIKMIRLSRKAKAKKKKKPKIEWKSANCPIVKEIENAI